MPSPVAAGSVDEALAPSLDAPLATIRLERCARLASHAEWTEAAREGDFLTRHYPAWLEVPTQRFWYAHSLLAAGRAREAIVVAEGGLSDAADAATKWHAMLLRVVTQGHIELGEASEALRALHRLKLLAVDGRYFGQDVLERVLSVEVARPRPRDRLAYEGTLASDPRLVGIEQSVQSAMTSLEAWMTRTDSTRAPALRRTPVLLHDIPGGVEAITLVTVLDDRVVPVIVLDVRSIAAQSNPMADVLRHELSHVLCVLRGQDSGVSNLFGPTWLNEGLASWLAGDIEADTWRGMELMLMPDWATSNFDGLFEQQSGSFLAQFHGALIFGGIESTWGAESCGRFVDRILSGESPRGAVQSALGVDWEEFRRRGIAYARRRAAQAAVQTEPYQHARRLMAEGRWPEATAVLEEWVARWDKDAFRVSAALDLAACARRRGARDERDRWLGEARRCARLPLERAMCEIAGMVYALDRGEWSTAARVADEYLRDFGGLSRRLDDAARSVQNELQRR